MKRKLPSYRLLPLMLFIFPTHAWSQSSAVPWSAFSGGFGVATSSNTTVQASMGELVGTSEGGNTIVKSGFLVVRLQPGSATAIDVTEGLPATYALRQNYPNPFNPGTTLRFDLPVATEVYLIVYDLLGREVAYLGKGQMGPGHYQVAWDGLDASEREVSAGVYIARLVTPEYTKSIKLVLLR